MKFIELNNSHDFLNTIKAGQDFIRSFEPEERKQKIDLAFVYLCMGNAYFRQREYGIAMDYYYKSNAIYKEFGLENLHHYPKTNIALIYSELGEYEESLRIYKESLPGIKKVKGDTLSNLFNAMARANIHLENYTIAEQFLDSALSFSKTINDSLGIAYTYRNIGWLNSKKDEWQKTISYYNKSLAIHESKDENELILIMADLLCHAYLEINQPENALNISQKYFDRAEKARRYFYIKTLSDHSYKAFISLGEYKSAINILEKYSYASDSLENEKIENEALITQLRAEAANEVELLKQQDVINNQTIQFQTTLLGIAITAVVLVILVAIFIYRGLVINKRLSNLNKEQSDRLKQLDAAKSRFFANISHDLRTPLSLMMGSMEQVLLNEDIFLNDKAERQLKTGLINGQRIIHLTNEINELIKMEDSNLKIEKRYVNIDQMLSLFVSMFASMAEMKGVRLSYSKKIFSAPPIVSIDIVQFEKVLFNLITNALKHTKKDDVVTVSLDIAFDEKVEIAIVDSGEGIPEDNVPYIFERYYQAPNTTFKTQEGFGIGLALVKEIIDKHSAEISVKSKHGQGSQFTILLNLEKEVSETEISKLHALDYSHETREIFRDIEEVDISDKPVISSKVTNKDKEKIHTILIVEDHPEIRQYIQDLIEPSYNILTASNGKRALKVLDSKSADLIITDLMMPWFDGFELLEKLKEDERLSNIPVLVLSARTSEEDKERVLAQGVNDFLYKPFNAKELMVRIKNLLDRKSKWNNNNKEALFINNTQTLNDIEKSLLEKVEEMIMSRVADPNLSVGDLAKEIAVSERKFFRMIKKLTDSTPYEYIKEIRLQYINKLIREKKIKTSTEAAKHIGMNNVSHFNEQFKSRFGKKPTEMLK